MMNTQCCICSVSIVCVRHMCVLCAAPAVCKQASVQRVYGVLCSAVVERHDAVFVVGALDETVILRGMRYHPIDVEISVQKCHKKICEW